MKKLCVILLSVIAVCAGGLFLLDLATKNSDYPLFQLTDTDPERLRRFTSGYDFFDESGINQPPFIAAVTWTVEQQVVVLADSTFQPLLPSSSTMIRRRSLLAANGEEIPLSYDTADRKTFSRITIAGKAYQYTNGNTFMVALKNGEVQVLQLKDSKLQRIRVTAPASSGVQIYRRGPFDLDMNLHEFRRENAEARKFFSHLPETR